MDTPVDTPVSPPRCPRCGRAAHTGGAGDFECSSDDVSTRFEGAPQAEHAIEMIVSKPVAVSRHGPASLLSGGAFVGEYRVDELIGEGGMGTVYRAQQPLIGKTVAIKVLAGVLARDENAIKRFVLEARAVNEVRHPNLVDIFSFGQLTDGRYYYVMEYLEGRSLARRLRDRGRLPPAEAVPIFLDVGAALDAVHRKGIVHRDLKPDNIFLVDKSGDGTTRAKLLDFGLAKLLEPKTTGGPKTKAGSAIGTPQYMAPEQCQGAAIDARADIYALGIMLFQTLCGRVPFEGKSVVEIWQAQVHKAPPPPSALSPDTVTPELDAIVLKMLAKDARDRFQTAGEVCEALARLGSTGAPVPASVSARLAPAASAATAPEDGTGAAPGPNRLAPLVRPAAAGDGPVSDADDSMPGTFDGEPASPPAAPADARRRTRTSEAATRVETPHIRGTPRPPEEVEDLRTALGLTIIEPAFESQDPSQISALNIDLRAAEAASTPAVVMPAGPVLERNLPAAAPRHLDPPRPRTQGPADAAAVTPPRATGRWLLRLLVLAALAGAAWAALHRLT